jgi:hypothetical protein
MTNRNWVELNNHPNYEITTDEPWQIRRKSDGKIVNSWLDKSTGYFRVHLEQKNWHLHRIIAQQFIDNPNALPQVDHINRNRTNNSLNNLRWVPSKTNQNNLTSMKKIKYEYFNELPEGYELFTEYRMKTGETRHFDNLYVNFDDEIPKFISCASEHQYRQLYTYRNMVQYHDINGQYSHICFSRINKTQNRINTTQQGINETQQQINQTQQMMVEVINKLIDTMNKQK